MRQSLTSEDLDSRIKRIKNEVLRSTPSNEYSKQKRLSVVVRFLTLTNSRALYWKRENMLVLSDLHIGKTAHFRKAGIAIPSEILDNDLKRLAQLIQDFEVETILIVGDLFHAEVNNDIQTFKEWKIPFESIEWRLIKGNHDRLKLSVYKNLGIEVDMSYHERLPFRFVHDVKNCEEEGCFCISGHTHPGVLIRGRR